MAARIRKGDTVYVLSGKFKGQTGEVLRVDTDTFKAVVQGVNVAVKHEKPRGGNPGGIVRKEMPIAISNLSLLDPKDNKPVRVGFEVIEGKKVRVSKRSGEVIEAKILNRKAEGK